MFIGFDADQDCSAVAHLAKARGVAFVCRYLKNLGPHEAATLSGAGLQIVSIWETTAERALSGRGAGALDGAQAALKAKALGQPPGSAIVATVDFDASVQQQPAVMAYLAAFKAGLAGAYKLMVYANGAICQAALDGGTADYAWLAGGSGMRGTRDFAASARPTIEQDVGDKRGLSLGISIDSDVAASADFGGWTLGAAPAAQPAPQPVAPKPVAPAPKPAPQVAPVDDSEDEAEDLNAAELQNL